MATKKNAGPDETELTQEEQEIALHPADDTPVNMVDEDPTVTILEGPEEGTETEDGTGGDLDEDEEEEEADK